MTIPLKALCADRQAPFLKSKCITIAHARRFLSLAWAHIETMKTLTPPPPLNPQKVATQHVVPLSRRVRAA